MSKESENKIYSDSSLLQHEERRKLHAWGKRNWFQLGVFLATIGIGFQFFIYVHPASGNGVVTVLRPPGDEGFLPIGALMGWKLFDQTGIWDPIHPAAMVFLGFAGFISLALRKSSIRLKSHIQRSVLAASEKASDEAVLTAFSKQ